MILIGQFDSPFVRRVGIALRLYGVKFEHWPWSVWADAEQIARFNPLRRVPVLVRDDGISLVESSSILDALDDEVGPERALLPRSGPARALGLRVCSLATGLGDKAVSLLYERLLRNVQSEVWLARCRGQVADTLDLLECERRALSTPYWLGSELSHADIAVACVVRFVREAHPDTLDSTRWRALLELSGTLEALSAFREISQPLTVVQKS